MVAPQEDVKARINSKFHAGMDENCKVSKAEYLESRKDKHLVVESSAVIDCSKGMIACGLDLRVGLQKSEVLLLSTYVRKKACGFAKCEACVSEGSNRLV